MIQKVINFVISFLIFFVVASGIQFLATTKAEARGSLPQVKKDAPLPSDLFVELAKMVNPTVVNISTSVRPRMPSRPRYPGFGRDPFFDLFEQFMQPQMPSRPQQSLGTGFIIRKDGLILTNNHVVQNADVIKVHLSEADKKGIEAEVIGQDARTDIALIKIKTKKNLHVAKLGSSAKVEVGEWVAAFGNPFGHGHTMTKGIISAKGRQIDELNRYAFLQTDASINPGNSGGPLVNVKGEVVGVNTAIDARAQGIGFAIPIDNVKSILPTLEKNGGITRGYIGVRLEEINDSAIKALKLKSKKGVLIADVLEDGPADKGGIKPYDVITKFGSKNIESRRDLVNAVSDTPIGKKIKLKVIREGKEKTIRVAVGRHPDDKPSTGKKGLSYKGQKAPFNLGFKVSNYSDRLAAEYNIEPLREARPIVIDVEAKSPAHMAGFFPGDVILDVNRRKVKTAKDVLRRLRKRGENIVRLLRGDMVLIVYL